ncbi:MAG TPA: methylmalonyl Co-A mutase-associated GTPase MeaB, partial [Kofleriaceae bacterium]|nr:methylmalonyl Co-A mutase-associated GTPase MeaB [Kofleriaceae bacterium]
FEIAHVLDAMGFHRILIETVGVGQDEVDVMTAAHTTVVVSVPGLGDDIQALKAGLLEVADVLAVNKADREGADRTAAELRRMLGLRAGRTHEVAVVPTIATRGTAAGSGVLELAAAIEAHRIAAWTGPGAATRATTRARAQLDGIVRTLLAERAHQLLARRVTDPAEDVAQRRVDPWTAAERIVDAV